MRPPRSLTFLLLLAGCAAQRTPAPPPVLPVHADVSRFAWLAGAWAEAKGGLECWTPAGDALIGVGFSVEQGRTTDWEVMFLRRAEQGVVLEAMPGGAAAVAFAVTASSGEALEVANPAHDFPKTVRYARSGDGLSAVIGGDGKSVSFEYRRAEAPAAPALEAADRRFNDAVAARGVDAWVEAFDARGAMGRPGRRVEGAPAIREAMGPLLASGKHLVWAPIASALSPAGDLGFTVGRWRFLADGPGGTEEKATGAYVTVWARQADGSWKVLFDVGDGEG